jgi:hypothetical protein
MGQGAYDVDDFADTYLCGATTGSCQLAPVWGAGRGHRQVHLLLALPEPHPGRRCSRQRLGGYNYAKLTVWGDIDNMAATWLYGDYMDDGKGGLTGWFWADSSKYNTYGITEKNYRLRAAIPPTACTPILKMPFQPIDNLGQYWFQKFLATPTVQNLGFVMHTTDLLQPHHVWTTSDLNHSGWETWVNDNYYTKNLNDSAKVTTGPE